MKDKHQLIFHVGLHKTATTFLQYEIFPKIEDAYLVRNFDFDTVLPDNGETIIVSNEELSGTPNISSTSESRYEIAKRLSKCFPDAKIIVAFRKKDTWLKSYWKQYIVEGGTFDFETFKNRMDKELLDFEKYESLLKHLFKDVFVYQYEDFKVNKKQIITDMCSFMGVKEPEWKDLLYRKSLSGRQIETLRKINRVVPERYVPYFKSLVKTVSGAWSGSKNEINFLGRN